jgi:hypothetical protein
MRRASLARARSTVLGLFVGLTLVVPVQPVAAAAPADLLRADLNGRPMELARVGSFYCHDFDYPEIHCFSTPGALEASVSSTLASATAAAGAYATSSVSYVVVYEFTSFQGAYMYMSQDYSMLGPIGWNDRIRSLRGVNNQTFVFWTDWLYSGTRVTYCCNFQYTTLGVYNDAFSSVFRY